MAEDYSIKFFCEHYLEHRGILPEDKEKVQEAFMGGAHTLFLMVQNAAASKDPSILMTKIAEDLIEFMEQKNVEAQFKNSTIQ